LKYILNFIKVILDYALDNKIFYSFFKLCYEGNNKMKKGIENFVVQYLTDNRPLNEMGYFLRKEFVEITYDEAVTILNKVLDTCRRLNIVF